MRHKVDKPVIIVGAGLAGLTAASFLRKRNIPFRLFEAGPEIAGLARSFRDDEGFTYDFGAHFITNRLAEAIGIEAHCRTVPRYSETVWLNGRSYGYPFGLLRVPRFLLSGMWARFRSIQTAKPESAQDWFRQHYGAALADEVALPLLEAWSGAGANQLAHTVASSLPQSIVRVLWLKLASRLKRKAVGCGYSRELREHSGVWHVYPEGGIGALCQELAKTVTGAIELNSPVQEIRVEDGRVVGVTVNGEFHETSAVVSTAPVNVLPKLVKGSSALDHLARFRYRPMVFVNLRLQGRHLLPDVVTWTPEGKYPFFRLTETPLSMPWLAPVGKTVITVDLGCERDDSIWSMNDAALGEFCLDHLGTIIPDARARYLGCRVLRTPVAYPVFLRDYEDERCRLEQGTGIDGLYSIGRNGEFMHIFMEDVHARTLRKMDQLAVGSADPDPIKAAPPVPIGRKEALIALLQDRVKQRAVTSQPIQQIERGEEA